MTPFNGIVISSTKTGLDVELSNGHKVKGLPPRLELCYGQAVLVYYDHTKDRYGRVEALGQTFHDPGLIQTRETSDISYDDEILDIDDSQVS